MHYHYPPKDPHACKFITKGRLTLKQGKVSSYILYAQSIISGLVYTAIECVIAWIYVVYKVTESFNSPDSKRTGEKMKRILIR